MSRRARSHAAGLSRAARSSARAAPACPARRRCSSAAAFERRGDLLVRPDGRGRPVPGRAVRLVAERVRERRVRGPRRRRRGAAEDGGAQQRMLELDPPRLQAQDRCPLGLLPRRRGRAEAGGREQDRLRRVRLLERRDQRGRGGRAGEAFDALAEQPLDDVAGHLRSVAPRARPARRGRAARPGPARRSGRGPPDRAAAAHAGRRARVRRRAPAARAAARAPAPRAVPPGRPASARPRSTPPGPP